MQINFFEKDGKIHFTVPENPELEAQIRASVKKQTAPAKSRFFFERGVKDAAISIQTGTERKFGTPMVEVENPFNGVKQVMTCKEAKGTLEDIGGNYYIRQVSGSPLPECYFSDFRPG